MYSTILGTGYDTASVLPLSPFLCHNCHRCLWLHEAPSVGQEAFVWFAF